MVSRAALWGLPAGNCEEHTPAEPPAIQDAPTNRHFVTSPGRAGPEDKHTHQHQVSPTRREKSVCFSTPFFHVRCACFPTANRDGVRFSQQQQTTRVLGWVGLAKMLPRLLAVLATLVCGGEGGRVVGSSVHGFRPTEGPIEVGNAVASSKAEGGRIISDSRRGQCSGGSLSARALCVRARGGSMADVSGLELSLSAVCARCDRVNVRRQQ